MKKIFIGVMLSVLLIANSALAMTFSQPVKIGSFVKLIVHHGKFEITGASYNSGKGNPYYGKIYYTNGVARFSDGEDALYLHYKDEDRERYVRLGGKTLTNTVKDDYIDYGFSIFKVKSDAGYTFYLLEGSRGTGTKKDSVVYDLIGRKPDGTWVKYFMTDSILKEYLGRDNYFSVCNVKMSGDTIVMQYEFIASNNYEVKSGENGEFRFKWDERAQWFSVEQIKY